MGAQSSVASSHRGCCTRIKGLFSKTDSRKKAHSNIQSLENLDASDQQNGPNLRRAKTRNILLGSSRGPTFQTYSYSCGDLLGKGPHGSVYEALCLETGEIVAYKKMRCVKSERQKVLQYLEGKLMNLNHDNLLRYIDVYASSENETDVFMISRLNSGCSLRETLKKFHNLDEKTTRVFCRDIMSGLAYLQENETWHSNLKPNNILIEANGRIKLSDFFTVRQKFLLNEEENKYIEYGYRAPEVFLRQNRSIKGDVWSLGCIMIEMLTNKMTWSHDQHAVSSRLRGNQTPEIPSGLSAFCEDFIRKCLIMDESQRPGPKDLLHHDFLEKEAQNEAKHREFLRELSQCASPTRVKARLSGKKNAGKAAEEGSASKNTKGESSISERIKNEMERKKYEDELLAMLNNDG